MSHSPIDPSKLPAATPPDIIDAGTARTRPASEEEAFFEAFFGATFGAPMIVIVEEFQAPCVYTPPPSTLSILKDTKKNSAIMGACAVASAFFSPAIGAAGLLYLAFASTPSDIKRLFRAQKDGETCKCADSDIDEYKKRSRVKFATVALSMLLGTGANLWLNNGQPAALLVNQMGIQATQTAPAPTPPTP